MGRPHFVSDHALRFIGDFPHNTNGGHLGCGQAGAACGFLGLVEVLRQVTRHAGERQVPDACIGMASGYVMPIYDRCVVSGAAILEGI